MTIYDKKNQFTNEVEKYSISELVDNINEISPDQMADLWQMIQHQGSVNDCSVVAATIIMEKVTRIGTNDWNPIAMVAAVECYRKRRGNIERINDKVLAEYADRFPGFAAKCAKMMMEINAEKDFARSCLAILAYEKQLGNYGDILIDYLDEEIEEMKNLWEEE